MDVGIWQTLMGLGSLSVINIALVAYSYGKLKQKVDNLCERVSRLEHQENSH